MVQHGPAKLHWALGTAFVKLEFNLDAMLVHDDSIDPERTEMNHTRSNYSWELARRFILLQLPAEPEFAHAHIISVLATVLTLVSSNPQGFPPFSIIFTDIGSIMSHFSHNIPYVQSIPSIQKDLNLPPTPNNTYTCLLMIMLYSILWKIQVVHKGGFLRENLGFGRTRNFRQEPFPSTTSWVFVENSGRFTRKNIGSGQTSGSVRLWELARRFILLQLNQTCVPIESLQRVNHQFPAKLHIAPIQTLRQSKQTCRI